MIIVGVNLNKKSYATTFILLLFFFSYRAALSRLEVTMFYYNFCFSQCYQCLALKYICTRLHNCFFFSLSQCCSSKRIGGASLETDEKDWEVCHSRQMGKIFDQGTICMLYYSALLEYAYDELLCQQSLV